MTGQRLFSTMLILFFSVMTLAGCGMVKQSYIDSFVESERGKLPKVLFANLNAIDIQSGDLEIIYICEAKNIDDEKAKLGQRTTQMALQDYIRNNKEKLSQMIDNKIKLTISLVSKKTEEEIFRLTEKTWEL